MLTRLLVGLVDFAQRRAFAMLLAGLLLGGLSGWYATHHLGVSTDTDLMFSDTLPWRRQARELAKDFPQFHDLLVAVIDAREPEQAEATAQALQERLAADTQHFLSARRPLSSCFNSVSWKKGTPPPCGVGGF